MQSHGRHPFPKVCKYGSCWHYSPTHRADNWKFLVSQPLRSDACKQPAWLILQRYGCQAVFILFSTQYIFVNISGTPHAFIRLQGFYPFRDMDGAIRGGMVRFIQPSPFQAAHVTLYHSKGSRYPVNHRTEITFQFSRGRLVTVYAHIGINAHPLTVANPPEASAR